MSQDPSANRGVLQFAAYGAPYAGNFIASLTALERTLAARGQPVTYLFPVRAQGCDWAKDLQQQGGNVHFLEKAGFFASVRRLRRLLMENRIGILHVHFIRYGEKLAALLACMTCGHRVKTVCHLHNHMRTSRSFLRSLPHRLYFAAADAFVCCSASVARGILRIGASPKKVHVAENAIDFSRLDAYEPFRRSDWGVGEAESVALMFGFDYRRKGVDLAVQAVALLRQTRQLPVKLAISLSSRREEVEAEILKKLGLDALPDWILLLPPRNDVAAYYHMADLFLSPSREEGFCYSLVEAAYCRTPVVASAIDAQRDLALPEDAFFTPEDPDDLARHILAILENGRDESKLDAARQRVTEAYSIERWCKEVAAVYDALLR